jgi:flavin-dependent dehydrogenase
MESGRMAARSIIDWMGKKTTDLRSYDERIAEDMYPEFRVAARMAWTLYTFPQTAHRTLRGRPELLHLYADVLKGRETYQSFYAKSKAKAKDSFVQLAKNAGLSAFKG